MLMGPPPATAEQRRAKKGARPKSTTMSASSSRLNCDESGGDDLNNSLFAESTAPVFVRGRKSAPSLSTSRRPITATASDFSSPKKSRRPGVVPKLAMGLTWSALAAASPPAGSRTVREDDHGRTARKHLNVKDNDVVSWKGEAEVYRPKRKHAGDASVRGTSDGSITGLLNRAGGAGGKVKMQGKKRTERSGKSVGMKLTHHQDTRLPAQRPGKRMSKMSHAGNLRKAPNHPNNATIAEKAAWEERHAPRKAQRRQNLATQKRSSLFDAPNSKGAVSDTGVWEGELTARGRKHYVPSSSPDDTAPRIAARRMVRPATASSVSSIMQWG